MAEYTCPTCEMGANHINFTSHAVSSDGVKITDFRCNACGHMWETRTRGPKGTTVSEDKLMTDKIYCGGVCTVELFTLAEMDKGPDMRHAGTKFAILGEFFMAVQCDRCSALFVPDESETV